MFAEILPKNALFFSPNTPDKLLCNPSFIRQAYSDLTPFPTPSSYIPPPPAQPPPRTETGEIKDRSSCTKIRELSVAPLLAEAIYRVHKAMPFAELLTWNNPVSQVFSFGFPVLEKKVVGRLMTTFTRCFFISNLNNRVILKGKIVFFMSRSTAPIALWIMILGSFGCLCKCNPNGLPIHPLFPFLWSEQRSCFSMSPSPPVSLRRNLLTPSAHCLGVVNGLHPQRSTVQHTTDRICWMRRTFWFSPCICLCCDVSDEFMVDVSDDQIMDAFRQCCTRPV